ncbi:MAG: SGNH/GDSL hydrolase family protein [Alphaproteobacteria bacterium]|nr:SGNH/GDSL hydrolase family protein [Alphaproteobacteria bacterium]
MTARRWVGRLGLLVAGLLIGLVLAEVLLRLGPARGYENLLAQAPRIYDLSIFANDRENGIVLAPGASTVLRTPEFATAVRINRAGLRGPELGPRPPEGLRVLTVGDSFVLGLQVDEDAHFVTRLGAQLTEALGRPVEVLNAGVDGYGTREATRLADRLADAVAPDLVLLVFFTGNDFWDNAAGGMGPLTPEARQRDGPGYALARRFALAYALRMLSTAWEMQGDSPLARRHRMELAMFADPVALHNTLHRTRPALDAFAQLCRVRGWRCAIAVAPPVYAVHPERMAATFDMFDLDAAGADATGPGRAVVELSQVPALDLLPALREAGGGLYFTFDGHWTPRGHAAVADALTPFLTGLLPARASPEDAPAP